MYIFVVFIIVLIGFTSAEYVAYGFKSEASKTWMWGFLNRLLAIFSGNPMLLDHSRTDRVLGMTYNILFVIIFSMLLLNLIIALLTAGFEKALQETSDVMARRQYEKLHAKDLVEKNPVKRRRTRRNRKLLARSDTKDENSGCFKCCSLDLWDVLPVIADLLDRSWAICCTRAGRDRGCCSCCCGVCLKCSPCCTGRPARIDSPPVSF